MPIDPSFFLGIRGPVGPTPLPTPGFRPPGAPPPAVMGGGMPQMGMGGGGVPGFAFSPLGKPDYQKQRTAGDADLGGYGNAKPGGMFQLPDGTWAMNPNDPASYAASAPAGGGAGGGGGLADFFTGLPRRLFGSP